MPIYWSTPNANPTFLFIPLNNSEYRGHNHQKVIVTKGAIFMGLTLSFEVHEQTNFIPSATLAADAS